MSDFLLLMHNDAVDLALANNTAAWDRYFGLLAQSGCFAGGSAIGAGRCFRKNNERSSEVSMPESMPGSIQSAAIPQANSDHLTGFIRLRVEHIAAAEAFLIGNPVYEAGGTVEIRELPQD